MLKYPSTTLKGESKRVLVSLREMKSRPSVLLTESNSHKIVTGDVHRLNESLEKAGEEVGKNE